jgi:glycosyltransferase involved in cell wall biosynthesis
MKIAYVYDVVHPYVIGGAQKRIWELSTRLVGRGHQVTIFGMKYWPGDDIVVRQSVRLWGVCPPQPLFVGGRRSVREAVYYAGRVLAPLMREKYDIVDAVNFPFFPCLSAAFHSLVRRSKLAITWHEVWGQYWYEYLGSRGFFGKAAERTVACLPHRAIAVSQATKRDLNNLGRRTVDVVPNGADIATITAAPPSPASADIIYAGRLTREKNVTLLIKAVNLIREQHHNVSCLVIGDGPERQALGQEVRDLNLSENIHFKGHLDNDVDVFSCMKSAGVLVLPSIREGFGIVVVEANACGIPVVTVSHHQNAARDLVKDGLNGFISDLSPEDMARKILSALEPGRDWTGRCREAASAYDWDSIVDSLEQVYEAM